MAARAVDAQPRAGHGRPASLCAGARRRPAGARPPRPRLPGARTRSPAARRPPALTEDSSVNHRLPVSLSSFLPALLMAGSMAAHGAVQAQAAAAVREATVREATVAQDAAPAEATPAPEAAPAWAPRTGDAVVDA